MKLKKKTFNAIFPAVEHEQMKFFLASLLGKLLLCRCVQREKKRKGKTSCCWNQRDDAKLSLHLYQVTQISLIGPIEGQPVIGVIWERGKHLNPVRY